MHSHAVHYSPAEQRFLASADDISKVTFRVEVAASRLIGTTTRHFRGRIRRGDKLGPKVANVSLSVP